MWNRGLPWLILIMLLILDTLRRKRLQSRKSLDFGVILNRLHRGITDANNVSKEKNKVHF